MPRPGEAAEQIERKGGEGVLRAYAPSSLIKRFISEDEASAMVTYISSELSSAAAPARFGASK
jgi:hypothetical protein